MKVLLLLLLSFPILIDSIGTAHASCSCEPNVDFEAFCASTSLPEESDAGISEEPEACCEACAGANDTPTCDQCQVHECELLLAIEPSQTGTEAGEANAGCNTSSSQSGFGAILLLLLAALSWSRLRQRCR